LDLHALNQEKFALPDRVTAKRFIFKLLYGATAYGYSVDSDFINVGFSEKQWQRVIDVFYTKYDGIAKGHIADINYAKENGYLEIPSGRYYNFEPKKTSYGYKWPLTLIKNYPIQGFGADLVMLARIEFFRRLKASGLPADFICTVHDSLVVDTPDELCYNISTMLKDSIELVPTLCRQEFDYEFKLPIWCEISVGPNKRDLQEIKLN
jgi:DNA polymerase I-like protein with 3'-5' exonuclease and polymerase domains